MTWSTQSTRETTATPQAVWDRWTTASAWSQDDPGCRWATLELPVTSGSKGQVKTTGPAQKIVFTEVVALERMTFAIRLPGAMMTLPHTMAPGTTPGTLSVTHRIEISGPLAPLFGLVIGRGLARQLPAVVRLVTENAVLASAP